MLYRVLSVFKKAKQTMIGVTEVSVGHANGIVELNANDWQDSLLNGRENFAYY